MSNPKLIKEHLQSTSSGINIKVPVSEIKRFHYVCEMTKAMEYISRIGLRMIPKKEDQPDSGFQLDLENIPIYEQLVRYFLGDTDFSGDLKKGIVLHGPTGTGKTTALIIMRIFAAIDPVYVMINNQKIKFDYKIKRTSKIVDHYQQNGSSAIEFYANMPILFIDDFGQEQQTAKHYGNEVNVIGELIERRYIRKQITFITSNEKDFKSMYGDRVDSRMQEMFNFIVMKGKDRRINQ